MSEITNSANEPQKRNGQTKRIIRIISILTMAIPFLCLGWVAYTSIYHPQCLDIVSGKVPAEAEERFFKRIFKDTSNQNYDWIRSVSHPGFSDEIVHNLQQLEPEISNEFAVIYGDDLAGGYDRILEFDNGLLLAVYYDGRWPECPDDDVTDAEINEHLELTGISVRDNVDWLDR